MLYSRGYGAAFIATNRLGLGAKPAQVAAIAADPKAYVAEQIGTNLEQAPGWQSFDVGAAKSALLERAEITGLPREQRREAQDAAQETGRQIYRNGLTALTQARVLSDASFAERWAAFFSNHLTVSVSAGPAIRPALALYEGEVIRRHCFGRFADLVHASATHPAMLLYLDQARSVGPSSLAAQRRDSLGLNENYARELMELHTLGVDGGYDLSDIQNLANILTGWTIYRAGMPARITRGVSAALGEGVFIPAFHEPGRKTVLGQNYGEGLEATRDVIDDLCANAATARFLSRKLLRHFIGDSASEGDEEVLTRAYLDSQGDLRVIANALLNLDTLWQAQTPLFRTPLDYLTAMLRAVTTDQIPRGVSRTAIQYATDARQMPWTANSPQGWPEDFNAWADPNALKTRTEFSRAVAEFAARDQRADASDLAEKVLDLSVAPDLASALGNAGSREDALALLFASPQFMWR